MTEITSTNNELEQGWFHTPVIALISSDQGNQFLANILKDIVYLNKKGLTTDESLSLLEELYLQIANDEDFQNLTPAELQDAFKKAKNQSYSLKKYGKMSTDFTGEVLRAKINEMKLNSRDLSNPSGDSAEIRLSRLKSPQDIIYLKDQIRKVMVRSNPKIKTVDKADEWMVEDILETWRDFYFDITPNEMFKAHRTHHAQGENNGNKLYGQEYSIQYFGAVMITFQEAKRKKAKRETPQVSGRQNELDKLRMMEKNIKYAIEILSIYPVMKEYKNVYAFAQFGFVIGTMEHIWGRKFPFKIDPKEIDLNSVLEDKRDLSELLDSKLLDCQKGYLFMEVLNDEKKRLEFISRLKAA